MRLAFADQVGDRRGEHKNLHRRDTPFFVNTAEQALGDDAFKRFGKRRADFILLVGRKNVDHAVHRLGGALGVQGAKDEVTGARRGQRQLDGLEVPHFAHQNDVRVLPQRAAQRGGE